MKTFREFITKVTSVHSVVMKHVNDFTDCGNSSASSVEFGVPLGETS